MRALIEKILITERVRKEITKIDELAADIKTNGLLHPITVMSLDGGEYRLLAGLRRLKAVESLGETDIEVKVVTPANAEAELRIEISENEQRVNFNFSETMDFGRLLDAIEKAKGKKRMSLGGKGGLEKEGVPDSAPLIKGKRRDIVADKIGMGRTTYECAKYVAKNGSPEIIEELDNGQRSIYNAYEEVRATKKAKEVTGTTESEPIEMDVTCNEDKNLENDTSSTQDIKEFHETIESSEPETIEAVKAPDDGCQENGELKNEAGAAQAVNTPTPDSAEIKIPTVSVLSKADQEAEARNIAFNALSPQKKVVELQRQLKEERARAAYAESELARLKELRHNDVFHKDGIISNLKSRLANAEVRIKELEDKYSAD